MLIRRSSSLACLSWLVCAVAGSAQPAAPRAAPEGFTGTTANFAVGAGSQVSIQILRWSSDEERTQAVSAINAKGDEQAKAIAALPTVGYVWTTGTIGYAVKYAHRVSASDGGERIVVMTDHQVGSWEYPAWKVAGAGAPPDRTFSVVELRIPKTGRGDGRISFSGPLTVDEATHTVTVAGYEGTPGSLTNVRRESKSSGAKES